MNLATATTAALKAFEAQTDHAAALEAAKANPEDLARLAGTALLAILADPSQAMRERAGHVAFAAVAPLSDSHPAGIARAWFLPSERIEPADPEAACYVMARRSRLPAISALNVGLAAAFIFHAYPAERCQHSHDCCGRYYPRSVELPGIEADEDGRGLILTFRQSFAANI